MAKVRGSSQEELPHVQGKERQLCFPRTAMKRYPMSKEQPHIQGAVAAWVQEGQEELLHIQGQEGWL